jgi:hypothetical protein
MDKRGLLVDSEAEINSPVIVIAMAVVGANCDFR